MTELETNDVMALRPWRGLFPAAAGLVRQSIAGVYFTGDTKHHFSGENRCMLSGLPDSREHRFFHCNGTADLRLKWGIDEIIQLYPSHVATCALFPELTDARVFQAALDSIQLPRIGRRQVAEVPQLFTDGSCLHPRHRDLRLSGGAVVLASDTDNVTLWQGLVPGAQGIFRAELLAAGTAASMFDKCEIYSDCWAFVRKANRLLSRHRLGLPIELPKAHRDLWIYFWANATAVNVEVTIIWTPAHRFLSSLTGRELWLAQGNAAADLAARVTVNRFVDNSPDYQQLTHQYFLRKAAAKKVVRYHHTVALRCVESSRQQVRAEVVQHSHELWVLDDPIFLPPVRMDPTAFCPEYVALLAAFFGEVQWSLAGASGELTDTSLVELCVLATRAIGVYPPVYCGGRWRLVGSDPLASVGLFKTWKRAFASLCWPAGKPFESVGVSLSFATLGVRLSGAGVSGRFVHPGACSQEFVDFCGLSSTLGGIQLPAL